MVVPSLSIRVWIEDDKMWAEAPWLEKPISGVNWEEIYESAMRLRYRPKQTEPKSIPEMSEPYTDQAAE